MWLEAQRAVAHGISMRGHLPRIDIIVTVLTQELDEIFWLIRTKTVFAPSNPYNLDFTINFLALVILSKSCFIFSSQVNELMN